MPLLVLGAISGDGTKRHADASKSKAVRYKRLGEIDAQWRAEGEELGALSEQAEQAMLPAGLVGGDEIARRQAYLARRAEARAVVEARAAERLGGPYASARAADPTIYLGVATTRLWRWVLYPHRHHSARLACTCGCSLVPFSPTGC